MADAEFKGKLTDASLEARPDKITTPEENARRLKAWEGVELHQPPYSWVEILDWVENQCDFNPEWDVDDGRVNDQSEGLLPDFEGLDECCYESLDYPTPEIAHTTDIPESYGRYGDVFKPSKWYKEYLETIKYGEGLNVYWHLNGYNSKIKSKRKIDRGKKVGKLTKQNCPSKNHGNYLSDEELIKRAKMTGQAARDARRYLKRRGITWDEK